jgi:hypothetical protein
MQEWQETLKHAHVQYVATLLDTSQASRTQCQIAGLLLSVENATEEATSYCFWRRSNWVQLVLIEANKQVAKDTDLVSFDAGTSFSGVYRHSRTHHVGELG